MMIDGRLVTQHYAEYPGIVRILMDRFEDQFMGRNFMNTSSHNHGMMVTRHQNDGNSNSGSD